MDRCVPIFLPKVDVTSNVNELFRDGHMRICDRFVECRVPILHLKIIVTDRNNELLRDGHMSIVHR